MTPAEALELLTRGTAAIQANRETHAALQQALSVMQQLVAANATKNKATPKSTGSKPAKG